jgi:nitroimidazol reductase NimA-like FMN-containing flavoprotein (pyridoxamine 5'-phosphate oxidase superfamily)
VFSGDVIHVHNTAACGHFRLNVERDVRACFQADEPLQVFDYGRFECDSGLAYRSAIAYGRIRIVEDRDDKIRSSMRYSPSTAPAFPAAPRASTRAWTKSPCMH